MMAQGDKVKYTFKILTIGVACGLLSSCGTMPQVSMAELVSAAPPAVSAPTFYCAVDAAQGLLKGDQNNAMLATGPAARFSSFELDAASGVLRRTDADADGATGTTERYNVVQQGTTFRNWVAVKQISFAGNRLESQLSSATNAFIRIRPWDAPGYEHDRGRFFMVTNGNDMVSGHCRPSGTPRSNSVVSAE
jgi:hypothetical protein